LVALARQVVVLVARLSIGVARSETTLEVSV
jgi:hypothetical protein